MFAFLMIPAFISWLASSSMVREEAQDVLYYERNRAWVDLSVDGHSRRVFTKDVSCVGLGGSGRPSLRLWVPQGRIELFPAFRRLPGETYTLQRESTGAMDFSDGRSFIGWDDGFHLEMSPEVEISEVFFSERVKHPKEGVPYYPPKGWATVRASVRCPHWGPGRWAASYPPESY